MQARLTYSCMPVSDGGGGERDVEGGWRKRGVGPDIGIEIRQSLLAPEFGSMGIGEWAAEGPTPYVRIVRHSLRCRRLVRRREASFWDYWGPLQHLQVVQVETASCLTRLPGA